MKRLVLKFLIFSVIISALDLLMAPFYNFFEDNARGGDTFKNHYIEEICQDQVLIMGSSRAARHYVPTIIQDSLCLSCYNCGEPGCGVLTMYPRYKMVKKRYPPQLIIYEVTPTFDYSVFDDYSKYLGPIRQSSDKKPVRDAFVEFRDKLEPIRLMSSMYRNNSCLVNNIKDYVVTDTINRGYLPMEGDLHPSACTDLPMPHQLITDVRKFEYMDSFFKEIIDDGVKLCVIISPIYKINDRYIEQWKGEYSLINKYCKKNNIQELNFLYLDGISNDSTMFHDCMHLNEKGARAFTQFIIPELREIMEN